MADGTGIQWTEATWNPVVGCTHVSPGCDNCYAAREASGRLSKTPAYAGLAVAGKFTGEIRLLPERLDQPLRWRRPRRVFVNSMSDLFHTEVSNEFIADVFAIMARTPQHTYQLLTKRHARMRSLTGGDLYDLTARRLDHIDDYGVVHPPTGLRWPLRNVWCGVSVEDQKWADIRIPALLDTPAAVRWLSCEPLLGPVDLAGWLPRPADTPWWPVECRHGHRACPICDRPVTPGKAINWIVVGGESGPGARPMHPDSARSLRDQCTAAGVPFFFKQWGGHTSSTATAPRRVERHCNTCRCKP